LRIVNPGDYTIFRSVERPHMFATVDRLIYDGAEMVAFLEMKAAYFAAFKEWNQRVPIAYMVQCQQTIYVLGVQYGYIAVLGNGYDFRWYRVERHDRFIKRLCDRVDAFWDRVVRRDPPEPDGHKASLAKLFELHPEASAREVVDLPTELAACGAAWDAAAQAEKDAQRRKDEIKARVMARIGDATHARLPDDSGFAWTNTARGRQFRRVERVADQEQ
jgi:predicted phage-related endonuclease